MEATHRTFLVVEDNPVFRTNLQTFCRMAIMELRGDGLSIIPDMLSADSYGAALAVIRGNKQLDFVSFDLALSDEEKGQQASDRYTGDGSISGIRLLAELQQSGKQAIAVIVTGEGLSHARNALHRYGVLDYIDKSWFDPSKYKDTVKAALWYLDTQHCIRQMENHGFNLALSERAAQSWKNTLLAAARADIGAHNFPQDLTHRLASVRKTVEDPDTALPAGDWTEQFLRSCIRGGDDWTLMRVKLEGFTTFVAEHASQGKPLMIYLAHLLSKSLQEVPHLFVGLLSRAYSLDPCFIVVFPGDASDRLAQVEAQLYDAFAEDISKFADQPTFFSRGDQPSVPIKLNIRTWLPPQEFDIPTLLNTIAGI